MYARRLAGSGQRAGSSPNSLSTRALRIGPSAGTLWQIAASGWRSKSWLMRCSSSRAVMAAFIAVSVVMIAGGGGRAYGPARLRRAGTAAGPRTPPRAALLRCGAACGPRQPKFTARIRQRTAGEIGDDQLIGGPLLAASSADGRNSSGRLTGQWRKVRDVPRDRGLIHVEDLCPDFLGDVIADVSAGNDDHLAQGKFPWRPFPLSRGSSSSSLTSSSSSSSCSASSPIYDRTATASPNGESCIRVHRSTGGRVVCHNLTLWSSILEYHRVTIANG